MQLAQVFKLGLYLYIFTLFCLYVYFVYKKKDFSPYITLKISDQVQLQKFRKKNILTKIKKIHIIFFLNFCFSCALVMTRIQNINNERQNKKKKKKSKQVDEKPKNMASKKNCICQQTIYSGYDREMYKKKWKVIFFHAQENKTEKRKKNEEFILTNRFSLKIQPGSSFLG